MRLWDAATGRSLLDHEARGGGPHRGDLTGRGRGRRRTDYSSPKQARPRRYGVRSGTLRRAGQLVRELQATQGLGSSLSSFPLRRQAACNRGDRTSEEPPRKTAAPWCSGLQGTQSISGSRHGRGIRQFPGEAAERGRQGSVNAVAFTPDGRTLISGEESSSIVLYDASNSRVRQPSAAI